MPSTNMKRHKKDLICTSKNIHRLWRNEGVDMRLKRMLPDTFLGVGLKSCVRDCRSLLYIFEVTVKISQGSV